MSKATLIVLALIGLALPMLGFATGAEPAQRGTPIAEFLDSQGQLRVPAGYAGSLDPKGYRMLAEAGEAPKFVPDSGAEPEDGSGGEWTAFGGIRNGCNGVINAIARLPNGDFVVGGLFSICTETVANNIALYSPSSNTWSSLGTGSGNGVNRQVFALAVSGSDLYVGGQFTQAGGQSANFVARWNGSVWSSLGTGIADGMEFNQVNALAVSGSDLYVGGRFLQAGGLPANNVARWNGSNWSNLGMGIGDEFDFGQVNALAVSGSDLYVGGTFRQAGGLPANSVARWNGSGWSKLGSDSANGVVLGGLVNALAISGSDLYVGGFFFQAGGIPANYIARWNGSVWSSLGADSGNGVNRDVRAIAVLGSDIYVGGFFTQAGGLPAKQIARWNGSVWSSLDSGSGNGVDGAARALAVSGSELYVGGYFMQAGGIPANNMARWNGSVWSSLGNGSGNGVSIDVRAVAVSGSDLYIGGGFTQVGGAIVNRVARWNGSAWSGLGDGMNFGFVYALAVSGNDLYVGGQFAQAGGVTANNVARWNGSAWSSLGTGTANVTGVNSYVLALAVSGSNLYVGGAFTQAGGLPANSVARWDGSVWSSLGKDGGNGVSGEVRALAILGSDLYVGGQFTQAGGLAANRVARWNGSDWKSLGADGANGVNSSVNALAVSGSNLYVGGVFTRAGGALANRVARWNGSVWSSLGTGGGNGVNSEVQALAVFGSDLYVGGRFTQAGGAPANRVARWSGNNWSNLGAGIENVVSFGNDVISFAASDRGLYVAGSFGTAGGQVSSSIAKWTPDDLFQNGFEGN